MYTLYHLNNQLSPPTITWQPQISSTQALPRSIAPRGEAIGKTTRGLCHHDLTSMVVPEIDHWSRVVDLTCNGSSQTNRVARLVGICAEVWPSSNYLSLTFDDDPMAIPKDRSAPVCMAHLPILNDSGRSESSQLGFWNPSPNLKVYVQGAEWKGKFNVNRFKILYSKSLLMLLGVDKFEDYVKSSKSWFSKSSKSSNPQFWIRNSKYEIYTYKFSCSL